jgi:uncharacterized repeat protein (TIGR01451 family)
VAAAAGDNAVITNTVTMLSDDTTPVSASDSVIVNDPLSDIAILKIELTPDRSEINAGEEALYTVDVGNIATVDALDLEIIAFLPANVMFVTATDGGVLESNSAVQSVRWDLGALTSNSQGQVFYRVRHIDNPLASASNPSAATVEKIDALVSVSASNALPITSDTAAAVILVIQPVLPPEEFVPVPMLGVLGLWLLILLLGLIGAYRRREI